MFGSSVRRCAPRVSLARNKRQLSGIAHRKVSFVTTSAPVANVKSATPDDGFRPGLEGVVAFRTEIAEPDRDGGALRYRGVNIEDLAGKVTFGDVWALLV